MKPITKIHEAILNGCICLLCAVIAKFGLVAHMGMGTTSKPLQDLF